MSANFPNNPSDSSLPDVGMYNPDPNTPSQSVGGNSKVVKTDMSGPSSEVAGYGHMSPDLKNVGMATGDNTSGIPAAQPIEPMLSGDPNHTAVDMDEASSQG